MRAFKPCRSNRFMFAINICDFGSKYGSLRFNRFQDQTPAKIYDELCACGCYRSQHNDIHGLACLVIGNGECLFCDCKQFTWKGFLVLEEPAVSVVEEVEMFLAQGRSIKEGKVLAMPEKVRS